MKSEIKLVKKFGNFFFFLKFFVLILQYLLLLLFPISFSFFLIYYFTVNSFAFQLKTHSFDW